MRSHEIIEGVSGILSENKVKTLFHFTRVENLASILKNGIVPISEQSHSGIYSVKNDYCRYDGRPDCSSFSIGFPNYKLFYLNRMNKYPNSTWAIIEVDAAVLKQANRDVLFCYTNAAALVPRTFSQDFLRQPEALSNMFSQRSKNKQGKWVERSKLAIPSFWTTDPQAEVLVSHMIPIEFISRIHFSSESDLAVLRSKMHALSNQAHITMFVNDHYFKPRDDHYFW